METKETYQDYLIRLCVLDDIKYDEAQNKKFLDKFPLPWKLRYVSEKKELCIITSSNKNTVIWSHDIHLLSFIVHCANNFL